MPKAQDYIAWFEQARRACAARQVFFAQFAEMLNGDGFSLLRANVGHRPLHPQVGAMSMRWAREENAIALPASARIIGEKVFRHGHGEVRETTFTHGTFDTEGFRASPMFVVFNENAAVRERIIAGSAAYRFPVLKDLAALGGTDYYAAPLVFTGGPPAFLGLATNRQGGFSPAQLKLLQSVIFPLFSATLEHFLRNEMVATLLRLYLGNVTGQKVLEGKIIRGQMDAIESVIWFSDIRGFTTMSTITPRPEMVAMLNEYYGCIIGAISRYGGEVLKFLGDGLLVIFKAESGKEQQTRYRALLAARAANRALDSLNVKRIAVGLIPIHHGIGLHYGTIEYGNIGSDTRLDFTAIGPAVNLASRIAAQCSTLDEPVLVSATLAASLRLKFRSLGRIELKGLTEPQEILAMARDYRPHAAVQNR